MDPSGAGPLNNNGGESSPMTCSPPPPLATKPTAISNTKLLGNFPALSLLGGGDEGGGGGETKVIYHIDDEMTPYLVKIPMPSASVTLRDFKVVLNKQNSNYKYFFKSMDADFGVVKEEIVDDSTILPCFNGRVVSWLVSADGSNLSDNCSELQQQGNVTQVDSHHFQPGQATRASQIARMSTARPGGIGGGGGGSLMMMNQRPSVAPSLTYQSASVLSSDLDSTSMFETESEVTFDRDMTECSSVQRLQVRKKPQRRKKRPPSLSRTSSYSSITDSTMSLNIITVSINMDTVNFLGISIVGQSNRGGDGGIYVGSIMKGGAVALDGRIEPGDMILQVNEVNFENMTNDEAVRVLRDVVQKPGPIKLVVAKCWDPNPKGYFTIPRTEPVRPIDPGAWVAHTQAIRNCANSNSNPNLLMLHENQQQGKSTAVGAGMPGKDLYYHRNHQTGAIISTSPGGSPLHNQQILYHTAGGGTVIGPGGQIIGPGGTLISGMSSGGNVGVGSMGSGLSIKSSLREICRRMFAPDSGLEIRDRMWLKITIPNAFIGADCVNWIQENVAGVDDRREARRIVSSMLRNNYIKHTVNKLNFSEQCYYVLGNQGVALLNDAESENESNNLGMYTGGDTDSLLSDIGPLPNPPIYIPPYSGAYQPPTLHADGGYQPIHYGTGGRISSGSSSSDVLTSKDMSVSQSDITSIIQQTGHMGIGNSGGGGVGMAPTNGGSNKSSNSSSRGKTGGHDHDHQIHGMFV